MRSSPRTWPCGHCAGDAVTPAPPLDANTTPAASGAVPDRAVRRRLDRVSLVCVENHRLHLAQYAMDRCLRAFDFREALLLSSLPVPPHPRIRHVPIRPLRSVAEYSAFMVRELGQAVAGDFVLVVQWDGFVQHPARWDDRFLDYDYIGAPWPGRTPAVGNGGFSLRSRRLLDALRTLDIRDPHPEDVCICVRHRAELEREHGIRFAPPDVARRFAWEQDEPVEGAFGFHAFFNFHRVLDEAELLDYLAMCDDARLHNKAARGLLKNLYRAGMWSAAARLAQARRRGPLKMQLDAWKLRLLAALRARAPGVPHGG